MFIPAIRLVALGLVLLLTGCAELTIDGSSEDDFYRSTGRMAKALPAEERDAFTDALMVVVMAGVDFTAVPGETDRLDLAAAMARLDGMTIDKVMAKAEMLRQIGTAPDSVGNRERGASMIPVC